MEAQRVAPTRRLCTGVIGALLLSRLLIAPVPAAGQDLPISELALWEAHMTSYGQSLCDFLALPNTFDTLLNSVYYDGQRVFLQIADYTGNASWTTCAQRAAAIYRDQYVLPNNGGVPGYWSFTTGLRMDAQRSGNTQSTTAVMLLSQNAAFAGDSTPLSYTTSADYSREVAYAILSYINAQALGQAPRQRRIDLVNQAYGHMNQWFVDFSWPGPWQKSPQTTARLAPFMVGLTAHTLIRDWEQTSDTRLIPALKLAADWMWANAWIPTAQAMWYESLDISTGAPDLNLLVAPIYAFLYRQTGDIKYRDEGDQIFAGGVVAAYLGGGKQFDQNYWWSFDYVKWRNAGPGSIDTTPPTVAVTAPLAGATVLSVVTVTASATDNVGVVGVQFKLDGANLGAEVRLAPYTVAWDTTLVANGSHTLTAVARDAAGNSTTSVGVSVTVANADTTPPTVAVTAPISGTTVVGTVTVSASATDNVGVAGVQFKLDGANLGAEVPGAPYSISWDSTAAINGTHALKAVARDAAGNSTTSAAVTVLVTNDLTPPTISGVVAAAISASGATITWTTDELNDSQVEYGLTTAYGSSTPLDQTLVTAHGQVLSGLAASTTYHYRVKSRDAAGNLAVSGDFTVATLTTTAPGVGMVGYWTFDEGSGTIAGDASGLGNTGSLINGPTWTAGMRGSALAFDGLTNYVNVPSTSALNPYPFTVAVWMKTSSASGVRGLVNKYVAYSANGWNLFLNNGNLCAWYYANGSNAVYPGGGCPFNVAGYNDNQWHYVAFAVDAIGGTLSVDGVARGSIAWTGTPGAPTTTQPVHIGHYPGAYGGAEYFPGLLDDVRLYNRALSVTELLALYNSNPTPSDATPPTVSISAPTADSTVAGTVTVTASASDNVGVAGVQFKLDGANLGAEVPGAPYSISWDSTAAINGTHALKAVARDAAGNSTTSAAVTVLVTNDLTPPTISGVVATAISASGATITWTTDELSDSQVEYGLTTAYGKVTALTTSLVTAHSQALSGLAQHTWYYYRVKSRDAAGNLAVSGDFTFKTKRR